MQVRALWDYFKFRVRGLPRPGTDAFDFIRPGMLVFDIGANLGNYSQVFLDKGAKVIAVEPQTYCNDFLRLRFRGNKNITLVKCGMGAKEEEKELLISSAHTLSSFNSEWVKGVNETERFSESHATWEKREAVKLMTLDQLIQKHGQPDYIKIDVEGYEKEVLKGLSTAVSWFSYEYTIPELAADALTCAQLIAKNGTYEFLSIVNENRWTDLVTLKKEIAALKNSGQLHNGDIFARRLNA